MRRGWASGLGAENRLIDHFALPFSTYHTLFRCNFHYLSEHLWFLPSLGISHDWLRSAFPIILWPEWRVVKPIEPRPLKQLRQPWPLLPRSPVRLPRQSAKVTLKVISGRQVMSVNNPNTANAECLLFAPDGKSIISGQSHLHLRPLWLLTCLTSFKP